jgi:type IV pilus assembly protein PilA
MTVVPSRSRRGSRRAGCQRGFSLIELLIVVAIIIIIVTVAMPNLTKTKIQPNEASALQSIKTIIYAENQFSQQYPDLGYTCNLAALGPPARGSASTSAAAGLIPGDLSTGTKSGYTFKLSGCTTASGSTSSAANSYQLTAVPISPGKSGQKAFCTDDSGQIHYDNDGNEAACISSGKPM